LSAVRLFHEARSILIESLYWDAPRGEWVWVDITAGALHRGDREPILLEPPLTAVQPSADGGYAVVLRADVLLLDAEGAIVRRIATLPHRHDGIRGNEGKVDPFGNLVIGSMDVTEGEPDGGLFRVASDGSLTTLLGGFAVANSLEWNDAGDEVYFSDTPNETVYRAPYGPEGITGEPEPFITGEPFDGMVRDAEGCFWHGLYGAGAVRRSAPDGTQLERVELPVPNVTSVALGGPDGRTLLIGSARENLAEEQLEAHPLSGSLFALTAPAPGRPVNVLGRSAAAEKE